MKLLIVLSLFFVVSVAEDELPLAEPCDPEACQLPDCRCSSTNIPGELAANVVPQFVLVTFDDNVNILNIDTYRDILYNRQNSNGCPAGATFYINHEYTNYQLVNELYNNNFEIALHSVTHQTPQTYWAQADAETARREIGDQKGQMAYFASIPEDQIKGVRIPFLQMMGNSSFQVMKEVGLEYDCTWGTINSLNPGLWPYTLDYASTQECLVPPCPTASIPGIWVIPMISWLDINNTPCTMVDSCYSVPLMDDEEAWLEFIVGNFQRHYLGNRAPFGFYVHEWYIRANPAILRALSRFMTIINGLNDVFMVKSQEVIEWVRNPVPVSQYRQQPCRNNPISPCNSPTSCGPLQSDHTVVDYWMQSCQVCPRVYPWYGNPLGH